MIDRLAWESSVKTRAEVDAMKVHNTTLLSKALAGHNVDTDDGTFTHELVTLPAKLKTRHGRGFRVRTTWTRSQIGGA